MDKHPAAVIAGASTPGTRVFRLFSLFYLFLDEYSNTCIRVLEFSSVGRGGASATRPSPRRRRKAVRPSRVSRAGLRSGPGACAPRAWQCKEGITRGGRGKSGHGRGKQKQMRRREGTQHRTPCTLMSRSGTLAKVPTFSKGLEPVFFLSGSQRVQAVPPQPPPPVPWCAHSTPRACTGCHACALHAEPGAVPSGTHTRSSFGRSSKQNFKKNDATSQTCRLRVPPLRRPRPRIQLACLRLLARRRPQRTSPPGGGSPL